ncbi:MAG: hypothetical protein ACREP2_05950 [Rhodanobacteraceae bacterium]
MPTVYTPNQWADTVGSTSRQPGDSHGGMLPTLLKVAGNLAFAGAVIDFLVVCVAVFAAFGNSSWTFLGVLGAFAGAFEAAMVGLLLYTAAAIVESLRDIRGECERLNTTTQQRAAND